MRFMMQYDPGYGDYTKERRTSSPNSRSIPFSTPSTNERAQTSADVSARASTSPRGPLMIRQSERRDTIARTTGGTMRQPKLDSDIKPVSEFRANAAELIEQVRNTRRPLILTQRGHSAAVVLDVGDYAQLIEELELLRDVRTAVKQIEAGQGVSNREAKAELRKRFRS
jgi:prevent-host-death family protein